VQDGLVDARRALWQLRPHAADGQDLAGALDALGRQLAESIGLRVELAVDALPRSLRPVVASSRSGWCRRCCGRVFVTERPPPRRSPRTSPATCSS
jgi:hypothetical protein